MGDPRLVERRDTPGNTNRMETENSLEEVLVRNPDMLMPGLTLVGRQAPTDSGPLDLLGVDGDGRLVVFELKREKLTRDAVAQVIDYCSWIESLTEADLAKYIAEHSGRNDVDKIDDFEWWYRDRQGKQLSDLRPTRMALVGLGVDVRALRFEGPPAAPTTKRVTEQWYCRLDKTTWEMHKEELTTLAQDVHDAWQEVRRSGTDA